MKKDPFPVLLYDHDFSMDAENIYPPSLKCFSMSPHSDHLGLVQSGHFAVSFPGNWHCLHAKDLSTCRLEMTLEENYLKSPTFLLYFRAKTKGTEALYLELLHYEHTLNFGVLKGTHYEVLEKVKLDDPAFGYWPFTLLEENVTICCN